MNNNNALKTLSLRDFFLALWQGKWIIIGLPLLFTSIAILVLTRLPDTYRAEVLLAPTESNNSAMQLGQLGGIAALAGINVNQQGSNQARLATDILTSRHFITAFIEKYQPQIMLMAAMGWDRETNQLVLDPAIYRDDTWVREVKAPFQREPSSQELFKAFTDLLQVHRNKETNMVTISIDFYSPFIAQNWLTLLVSELNAHMKQRDMHQAQQSLNYLEQQLRTTQVEEIRRALYQLIEEQTKTLMLTQVSEEYVFQVIDPPIAAELPIGPKRLLIAALVLVISGIFAVFIALLRFFYRQTASSS